MRTKKVLMQDAAGATGNGTAFNVSDFKTLSLQVSGTFVGTITFEGSLDETNYVSLQAANVASGAVATTTTAAGVFVADVSGLKLVRARVSAFTSGTITVYGVATEGGGLSLADIDVAGSENVVIDSITAGETHIGEVSCKSGEVSVTPVINTDAYTANDAVGSIQTLTSAARASGKPTTLLSLTITDLAMQSAAFSIYFFNANPSNGTYTNNAELDIHDTDMAMCVGAIKVAATDWINAKDNGVAVLKSIGLGMVPSGSANLYALVKTTTTPTYAVGDLTFKYFFFQD